MAKWQVDATAEIPYPWTRSFVIERSTAGAAASEAVKLFRIAVKNKLGRSKKLDEITLKIRRDDITDD